MFVLGYMVAALFSAIGMVELFDDSSYNQPEIRVENHSWHIKENRDLSYLKEAPEFVYAVHGYLNESMDNYGDDIGSFSFKSEDGENKVCVVSAENNGYSRAYYLKCLPIVDYDLKGLFNMIASTPQCGYAYQCLPAEDLEFISFEVFERDDMLFIEQGSADVYSLHDPGKELRMYDYRSLLGDYGIAEYGYSSLFGDDGIAEYQVDFYFMSEVYLFFASLDYTWSYAFGEI